MSPIAAGSLDSVNNDGAFSHAGPGCTSEQEMTIRRFYLFRLTFAQPSLVFVVPETWPLYKYTYNMEVESDEGFKPLRWVGLPEVT